MALLPPNPTHLVVRWVHVLSMATLFGGAVLCWASLRRTDGLASSAAARDLAASYEWLFWAGAGLLVLTGVGNLGALSPTIPGPGTRWGATFSVKLLGVVGLFLGSVVRSLGVVRLQVAGSTGRPIDDVADRLRLAYAGTAGYLLVVVLLAEVLAHG